MDSVFTRLLRVLPTPAAWRAKLGLSTSADVAALLAALLTTRGDLIVRGNGSPPVARLPIGAAGTLLRSDGTDAAWATVETALATLLTARGQIIRRGASAPEALAAQTANTFLGGDGTDIGLRSAAQVLASLSIATGSYTPTLTNVTNLDASTASSTRYRRTVDGARVWGQVMMDPTAAGAVVLEMTLPIAATLSTRRTLTGIALPSAGGSPIVAITANTSNNTAEFQWTAALTTNQTFYFGFDYGGIP